jgi:hypothetical protein
MQPIIFGLVNEMTAEETYPSLSWNTKSFVSLIQINSFTRKIQSLGPIHLQMTSLCQNVISLSLELHFSTIALIK